MWERCLLGLPTIVVITAENQSEVVHAVSTTGAIVNCGRSEQVTAASIANQFRSLAQMPARLESMSRACFDLMSAVGPTSAAATTICNTLDRFHRNARAPAAAGR